MVDPIQARPRADQHGPHAKRRRRKEIARLVVDDDAGARICLAA
jgi:hypothetical protein